LAQASKIAFENKAVLLYDGHINKPPYCAKLKGGRKNQTEHGVNAFISMFKKYTNITKLDRQMIVELIDKITISDVTVNPLSIVIYYNFVGCVGDDAINNE